MPKITPQILYKMKQEKELISALTCYNLLNAQICNKVGIEILLVGDSLGNVLLGYETTIPVTMEDILYFTKIVARGNKSGMLAADMPFLSYQASNSDAVTNAGRLIKEGGAEAVKLEGGIEIIERVKAILDAGIPVMGHLGLLPQSVHKTGGYKVQGKNQEESNHIIESAKKLEDAGAFAIVLECVPKDLAKLVTKEISIPTIGIGAGRYCDGQILVLEDMLGLTNGHSKKFVKEYVNLNKLIETAVTQYKLEVKNGDFPTDKHSF
ncbi:MAG: 3-methyl-2-oxobutanoate hydroxymethyltransferase [Elusimicrobiota bacterium]